MIINLQTLAKALGGEISGNQLRCPGPGHSAADRSLVIKLDANAPNGILFHSFAGDDAIVCLDYIRAKGGLPAFKPNSNGKHHRASDDAIADALMAAVQSQRAKQPPGRIVAIYDYTDAGGTLFYQVLKYDPKNFRQRQPDGKGGWIWNLDGVRRVLYRWPQLIEDKYATVHFTEGEKDAETLAALDLCSTTIASGKWTNEMVEALRGRNVWIFEDKDKTEAGCKRALEASERLHGVASQVRIIRLPGLTGEPGSKDVTNWLVDMGHTKDNLFEVCDATPDWEPNSTAEEQIEKTQPTEKATGELKSNAPIPDTPKKTPRITLTYFSDLKEPVPKAWLIKNVIARGETSSWFAPPGWGKSGLLLDIGMHGASATDWRGYRIKEPFGVLYFALERFEHTKRRQIAHRLRDNLPAALPIATSGQIIDLMTRTCVPDILDAIKEAEDRFSHEIGLVVIDTYAKGIAAGGGDENQAKDQNVALANLRRVIDGKEHRLHIATIGHTGKDEKKGERGSNAKQGDVDVHVQISGEKVKAVAVVKANDQADGPLTHFQLEPYEFGLDQDGDPFQTFIVSKRIAEAIEVSKRRLNPKQLLAVEALAEVVLARGVAITASDMPAGLKAVTLDQWIDELYRRSILDPDVRNPRARFGELRDQLAAKRTIGVRNGRVWLARTEEGPK